MLFHLYLLGKVSKKRIYGTARVIAYGTVVGAGLFALTIRSAVANVHAQSLEVGRKLADVRDLLPGAHEFRLNGQSVFVATSNTDETLKTVLDRFENHCDKSRAFETPEWTSLTSSVNGVPPTLPPEMAGHFGIVRTEDETVGDGVVMCFTGDHGPKSLFMALQAFKQSGDLYAFGNVRYLHAARQAGKTLVQTVWTDGSFKLDAIMPTPGHDTMGSDFATLPRPINSTRTLTAEGVGTPYAARVYTSTSSAEDVLNAFETKMSSDGWAGVKSPEVGLETHHMDGRWFIRVDTGEQAVVSVSKKTDTAPTTVVVGSVALVSKGPSGVGGVQ